MIQFFLFKKGFFYLKCPKYIMLRKNFVSNEDTIKKKLRKSKFKARNQFLVILTVWILIQKIVPPYCSIYCTILYSWLYSLYGF